jgi:hypothetical protein
VSYEDANAPGWEPPAVEDESSSSTPGATVSTVQEKAHEVADTAGEVAGTAQSAAKDVTAEAGAQARAVVDEVSGQARDLYATTRRELADQAQAKSAAAADGIRRLSDQVSALAEGRVAEAGPLVGYARDAQDRLAQVASRLDQRGPEGILDDVTMFARRRPLVFIGACAGAGFIITRFLRAGSASADPTARNVSPSRSALGSPSQLPSMTASRSTDPSPSAEPIMEPARSAGHVQSGVSSMKGA